MALDPNEPPPNRSRPGVDPVVVALEERLGCPLADAGIALAALTHKSYVNEHRGQALSDNERLEFLGDAVIDLAVAHRLMERFPDAREGELSKLRAAVVDEAGLAQMAREIGIGPLLRLGRGEELTGGREKASLLADAMEAVVAAVYLCGGLGPVLQLIDRFLGDAFARAAAGTLDRDFKTQFQELAQNRLRATPRYRVVAEHGPDHSKTFEVVLELRGEEFGRGVGRSKKDAEQSAARSALETANGRFGVEPRTLQLSPAPPETPLPEAALSFGVAEQVEPEASEPALPDLVEPSVEVLAAELPKAPEELVAAEATPAVKRSRATSRSTSPAAAGKRKPATKSAAKRAAATPRKPRTKR